MKPRNVGNWLRDNLEKMSVTMEIKDLRDFRERLRKHIELREKNK